MISTSICYVKIEKSKRKMILWLLSKRMKKFILVFLICFLFGFCSFFESRTSYYPSGVFFPLYRDGEIVYKGEIIDLVEKMDGQVYLSTRKGLVYCLDGLKRKINWTFEASVPLLSPPFLGLENIYVYDESYTLYCLDKEGTLIWKKNVKDRVVSGIAEFKKRIYFGTEEGSFFSLNASSGEEIWRFQAGGAIRSTPVFAGSKIIFGCDDFILYVLTEKGNLIDKFKAEDKIQSTPLVEKKYLYFGADDHYFYCVNLNNVKKKWKVKTGGKIFTPPVTDGKRILFLSWNNVLYCLNRRNGDILWWQIIPSRSFYHLEISGERIVVSSLSSLLVCFDIKTGEKVGDYDTGLEVKSNPLWLDPCLLISLYNEEKDEGKLVFLKKILKITLKSNKKSPQDVGKEIVFTVSAIGFYEEKYEFYLKEGENKEIVQEKSEKNSWVWFPEKEGNYIVGVEVVDEKESKTVKIPFVIK